MTLVSERRTGGFVFTWSIHNFSYSMHKENEYIESLKFEVESFNNTFYLKLYPKGNDAPGFISFYLQQDKPCYFSFNCLFSIRVSNGLFKERDRLHRKTVLIGYDDFLSLDELKGSDAYLDNDTLTLRCRMWRDAYDLGTSVMCYAHTKIKVSILDYVWTLNDIKNYNDVICKFNKITQIQCFYPNISRFKIRLLHRKTFGKDTIYFAIEQPPNNKKWFLNFKIHLLDVDGKVAHSVQGEHSFVDSEAQVFSFPFLSKSQLLSKENVYLSGGILTLRCELLASGGDVCSEKGSYEYGKTRDVQLEKSILKQDLDKPDPWKENMQRFYNEGKFSDVTVRTPNSQFPAHKANLCAQSEVFSAMFENDMKENLTGVVEIKDMEDETVSKMLMFLYTNSLDDIDYSMAYKLYFAADKYQITALHRKCSKYLVHSLDTSNVCDVLVLADTHSDQELKSIVQDFIFLHNDEIMNSENWKKLMESKAHLTSETMHLMIAKNFVTCLNHDK